MPIMPSRLRSALKAVGAGLVLDDFGTGHSSFAWLADLPADSLKIDHGLTRQSRANIAPTRSCRQSRFWQTDWA
jgi:EAL domain-containing protein (putative c-di-GMP-specific phosphodiesterase class I)